MPDRIRGQHQQLATKKWRSRNFVFSSIDLYENTLSFFFLIRICAESHWVSEKPHVSNHRAISTIHVCIEIESFPFRNISLNRKKEMCYTGAHFIQKQMSVLVFVVASIQKGKTLIWELWEKHSRFVMWLNEVTKCKLSCFFRSHQKKRIEDVTLCDIWLEKA